MTVWFDLPTEVRLLIYQHFYSNAKVLLHPLTTRQLAAYCFWSDPDDDVEGSELFDKPSKIIPTPTGNKIWTALRYTSKRLWVEAEPYYYACTSFEIECFSGHIISEPRFNIDNRIQHLTITWDTGFDEISLFLRRHFRHADTKMHHLRLEDGPFPYDICKSFQNLWFFTKVNESRP